MLAKLCSPTSKYNKPAVLKIYLLGSFENSGDTFIWYKTFNDVSKMLIKNNVSTNDPLWPGHLHNTNIPLTEFVSKSYK